MAGNPTGEHRAAIGGNEYVAKMTHRHAARAEELLGCGLMGYTGGGVQYTARVALALLSGQHGLKTLDDAYNLMDTDAVAVQELVTGAVLDFFLLHYPTKQAQEAEQPTTQAP